MMHSGRIQISRCLCLHEGIILFHLWLYKKLWLCGFRSWISDSKVSSSNPPIRLQFCGGLSMLKLVKVGFSTHTTSLRWIKICWTSGYSPTQVYIGQILGSVQIQVSQSLIYCHILGMFIVPSLPFIAWIIGGRHEQRFTITTLNHFFHIYQCVQTYVIQGGFKITLSCWLDTVSFCRHFPSACTHSWLFHLIK